MDKKNNWLEIYSKQKNSNAMLSGHFLSCVQKVLDDKKIKYKSSAFNYSIEGLINYMSVNEGEEKDCYDFLKIYSEIFENVESLNKYIFVKWPQIMKSSAEPKIDEVEGIKFNDLIKKKIIEYVKNQLASNEQSFFNKAGETLKYGESINVGIAISVQANFRDTQGSIRTVNHEYFDQIDYKKKTIKDDPLNLDKACFIVLIIANYIEHIVRAGDPLNSNMVRKKEYSFLSLLLKVLDLYSQTLLELEEFHVSNDLKINSYLSDPGKRKMAIKTRLKELLENFHNEDFPKEIFEISILKGSFKQLKLELGIKLE